MTITNETNLTEFRWKLTDILERVNEGQIFAVKYHGKEKMICMSPEMFELMNYEE